jgi:DDE superfamily endonuclease./helix-turn-helix, Psq domain.
MFLVSTMVRTYKRKSDRATWSDESMTEAVNACVNQVMGYQKAAKTFAVPQTTLERKVKAAREAVSRQCAPKPVRGSLGPKKPLFTSAEEDQLVEYVLKMEERLFGLTPFDLRTVAFQWAQRLGKQELKGDGALGLDWYFGFRTRHPQLTLRKPEATSAARAAAFNKVTVTNFFTLLTDVIDRHGFTGERIFNCDETGISCVPKHRSKVLSLKGRKQVGVLTSQERGNTVTVELCYSATGQYLPPMFVFPRKRANPQLLNDCPPGSIAEYYETGWMQSDIFLKWFKKFVEWTNSSITNPSLLLLDGHFTHTKNLEVIDYARDHGVVIMCFPPHCTHRLQPLDVSFMKPLSTYYDQAVTSWLRQNPGRVVRDYQIGKLFGEAFIRAANMSTAIRSFEQTGIWPVNPDVFP